MEDDDTDLDEIPLDIMRLAQDVSQTWRRCRRKACKRAKGCRGRNVPCAYERPPARQSRNPEKAARDEARAMAIFQRMLKEKLAKHERGQAEAAPQGRPPRRRGRY